MDDSLYITIKSDEEDFAGFQNLVPERMRKFEAAPGTQIAPEVPSINRLAARLHPVFQSLRVEADSFPTPTTRLLRLVQAEGGGEVAFFRPGQYLSIEMEVDGSPISRPYSIASSPADSLKGFYEIAVKDDEKGFAARHLFHDLKVGDILRTSGPAGQFYYDSIRDRRTLVGIAGGSGITPFRSMARAIADGTIDCSMTLFYGANTEAELAFKDEFLEIEKRTGGRFRPVFVLADEKKEGFERGFITREVLDRHADLQASTIFVCGPQAMYRFIEKELASYGLRRKFVRFELFGQPKMIAAEEGFPQDQIGKTYSLTVHQADRTWTVPARSEETLVCSMERAGIRPPTRCRSGECGFCRSQLVSGEVYVSKKDDGRRYGDVKFGFIHPCSSFPLSDVEIIVPPTK